VRLLSIEITAELLGLISEIDQFKGSWRTLSTLAPERLAALRKIATVESIGSSTRIEGAKLTDREVEEFLGRMEHASFSSRDEEEIAGYADAMDRIFGSYDAIKLTEDYIQQFHAILLRHSTKDERHKGNYKKLPNNVEAFDADGKSIGVIFETATPFDTPFRMQELVEAARGALSEGMFHPLLVIGAFIVIFLKIHPFQDGNGRLSRVLTTLLLLKSGYSYVPFSSLESVIEQNKESYYLALRRTQTTLDREKPDWDPWLRFFLRSLKSQKDNLEVKVSREPAIEGLHPDALKILEFVRAKKRVTTSEAKKLTAAPRPTVKVRLGELVKRGLLVRQGRGRGAWYGLPNPNS